MPFITVETVRHFVSTHEVTQEEIDLLRADGTKDDETAVANACLVGRLAAAHYAEHPPVQPGGPETGNTLMWESTEDGDPIESDYGRFLVDL